MEAREGGTTPRLRLSPKHIRRRIGEATAAKQLLNPDLPPGRAPIADSASCSEPASGSFLQAEEESCDVLTVAHSLDPAPSLAPTGLEDVVQRESSRGRGRSWRDKGRNRCSTTTALLPTHCRAMVAGRVEEGNRPGRRGVVMDRVDGLYVYQYSFGLQADKSSVIVKGSFFP
jgi:hypothetical protein